MKTKTKWKRMETANLIEAWTDGSTNVGYDTAGTVYIWSTRRFFHDKIQTVSCSTQGAARTKAYEIMDPFSY